MVCHVYIIIQNIFHIPHKRESNAGLEQHKGE